MRKIFAILIFNMLLVSVSLASADGDHQSEIEEGKNLVEKEISCDKLNNEQLEAIGEYFMEQMHPGEFHEAMHERMGIEEGTEYHEQFHVNIAKMMYCGEGEVMGSRGMMGGNMMSSVGMMNMMGTNMMSGSFGGGSWWLWSIVGMLFWIALIVALILLIIWLYKKITIQTTNGSSALEIVKKRFAKGEITKKEFESMKKEIR